MLAGAPPSFQQPAQLRRRHLAASVCPYWLEITRLAKQHVAKHAEAGDRVVSEADAVVSVMKERPWLYRQHKATHG